MKGRNEDEDVVDPLIAKYEPPKTLEDKIHAFIYGNPPRPFMERAKEWASGQNAMLALYLVLVVLVGTGNRVTFKLMQFALVNYSYFVSQLTTFIYVPVSFAIIFFKMLFTNHITPEMIEFPKYKFAVMGLLDSLQGLLITVGGNYVPGIMQNLLMQGVVPVTMLTSLLILRPRGCQRCKKLLTLVKASKRSFQQESTLPDDCTESKCLARLVADHREIFGWDKVDEKDAAETSDFLQRSRILEANNVLVLCSARPWKTHLSIFYSPTQYLGAAVIIAGLVVSVWPALADSGGGAFQWDVVFFSATIPTALSSVYKEIAFREVADMDVWYLNGWVALYQFYFGLFYAPLAAVMNQPAIAIVDIPQNLWHGFLCFLLGNNYITENCDSTSSCGLKTTCCDSCDGSLSDVSRLRALYGVLLYMTFNLTYNILLVLVIKYGSAALMYVASTIVLPLGAVGFMISAFMGSHATPFDKYNGAGLAVVLCGLIIYRFFAFKKSDVPYQLGDDYEHFNLDGTTTTTTGPSNSRTYVLTSPVDSKNAAK